MLRHHLLIAARSFNRHKSSFLINLIGLSTGLACTLFIYLWVADELSVNKFNEKDDRLYQVMQNLPENGEIHTIEGTQGPLASALAQELPEVEYATTIVPPEWFSSRGVITYNDSHVKASPQFVSKDFLRIFSCKIIQGNEDNLLPDINSIAISEELAFRLFHTTENLVGKLVQWNHQDYSDTYHITGLFEALPDNVTSRFDLLFNYDAFVTKRGWIQNWDNSDPSTFVLLREGTDVASFNKKISLFLKTKEPKSGSTLFAQKFSDRYLNGRYENGVPSGGRISYVKLFSLIGLIILLIASINFVNLSTARATRRVKEVGVKKMVGAARSTLIGQYLSESALVTFISLLIALALVEVLLPQFNIITGKNLAPGFNSTLLIGIGSLFLLTSILAGSYPALHLSGFSPAAILKGKLSSTTHAVFLRKGLVLFQFTISIILMVGVWIVYLQMEFVQSQNLGYNKDNIISFELDGQPIDKLVSFKTEADRIPGVINVGTYGHNLTGDHGSIELNWEGKDPTQHMPFANIEVGENFIETMGIEFKEGHSPSMLRDPESQIVLNEEAVRIMNLKDPIGKKVRYWGIESEIVGVTKNFNFESLHEPIKPSFFRVYPISPYFIVKIEGGHEQETIRQIEKLHNSFASIYPFEYQFIDDNYQRQYVAEHRVSVLSRYFAGIAVVISCLGLFGLAAFTAERRLKEIGIRKVLGSSVAAIVFLLSLDFTKIIVASIVAALPFSYLITKGWLEGFAFRIELRWWYFASTGLAALLIAWFTIGLHTIKAARSNPVNSLRNE